MIDQAGMKSMMPTVKQRQRALKSGFMTSQLLRTTGRTGITALSVVAAVIVATSGRLSAQQSPPSITLDEALDLFWRDSPDLQISRLDVLEAESLVRQAEAFPNPTVNAAYEPLFGDGGMQTEVLLGITQSFELPGLRTSRREAAMAMVEVARRRLHVDSLRLAFEVVRTYVAAAAATARVEHLRPLVEVFRTAEEWTQAQYREGESSGYEVRRLRLERLHHQSRLSLEEIRGARLRTALALLIYPSGDVPEVAPATGPDSLLPDLRLDTLYAWAELHRAELAHARAGVNAERAMLALTYAERSPEPSLSIGFRHQSENLNGPTIGLELPLPLFNRRTGDIGAGQTRLQAAEMRLALVQKAIRADLQRTFEAYGAADERVSLLASSLETDAEAILATAQTGYREGEMSLVELLDAVETYRDTRLMVIDLLAERQLAYYDLMRAAGSLSPGTGGGD